MRFQNRKIKRPSDRFHVSEIRNHITDPNLTHSTVYKSTFFNQNLNKSCLVYHVSNRKRPEI